MAGRSSTKEVHWHSCKRGDCKKKYQCICKTPAVDGLCPLHEVGTEWELLVQGRAPKQCCEVFSKPATKEEIKSYALAGSRQWYVCQACCRTQAYMPGTSQDPAFEKEKR